MDKEDVEIDDLEFLKNIIHHEFLSMENENIRKEIFESVIENKKVIIINDKNYSYNKIEKCF